MMRNLIIDILKRASNENEYCYISPDVVRL